MTTSQTQLSRGAVLVLEIAQNKIWTPRKFPAIQHTATPHPHSLCGCVPFTHIELRCHTTPSFTLQMCWGTHLARSPLLGHLRPTLWSLRSFYLTPVALSAKSYLQVSMNIIDGHTEEVRNKSMVTQLGYIQSQASRYLLPDFLTCRSCGDVFLLLYMHHT